MSPGTYTLKTAPHTVKKFLENPALPESRALVVAYVEPAAAGGIVLSMIAFVSCGFLGGTIFPGGFVVLIAGKRSDFGVSIFMILFGGALLVGAALAFRRLRTHLARLFGRRSEKYGYFVLQTGLMVRIETDAIIYLPWENIRSMEQVDLYQEITDGPSNCNVYKSLRVSYADGASSKNFYFRGTFRKSVPTRHADHSLLNLAHFDLCGKDEHAYKRFRDACQQFKPVIKVGR